MSRILIYSDPHLALIRGANTSISSSIRLRDTLQNQSERVATDLRQELECDKVFCLGDLFHTYSNSEEMIQSAAKTVQNTDIILAGNHDLENKAGSIGSLQLLSSLNAGGKFLINELGEADSFHVEHGNTDFLFVPHAANQELFETAIADAKEFAQNSSKWRVLCLHCNYDLTREGMPDTSLNLLSDKAKDLLSVFHFIFLGLADFELTQAGFARNRLDHQLDRRMLIHTVGRIIRLDRPAKVQMVGLGSSQSR